MHQAHHSEGSSQANHSEMQEAGCKYLESKWGQQFTRPDGCLARSGDFLLPNGWNAKNYDRARHQTANAILGLQ